MMIRKLSISLMALTLVWSTVACSGPVLNSSTPQRPEVSQETTVPTATTSIANGTYPVQQATYDDSSGEYTLMLLNTQPGQSMFRTANLPLARLTDEEVSAGKSSELRVEGGQPSLYLTPDFRIEYVHNVTETQVNPQTGQEEVVIVRQEPSFWTPFAGAIAGQVVGNLLFRPQYYMPPVYQPGVALIGYGGYGRSYRDAVSHYQSRHQAPPAEYRNRQFRSTGRLRSNVGTSRTPGFGSGSSVRRPSTAPRVNTNRPSGSGFGNSTLRRSNRQNERVRPSGGGFGSSRRSAPRRSSGGRRR
ncbi:MAG TPA: hypothetical protein V6D29_15180 [Leptolyngbyaceae cyanobacterium]